MMLRLRPLLAAFALALAVASAAGAQAAPAVSPEQAQAVARSAVSELRSPFCPGLMLEVCPTAPAEALRDSIRMMADQGAGVQDIVEAVLAAHGEEWRAVPKREGAGLWAWIIPPVALVAGIGALVLALRALRGRAAENAAEARAVAGTGMSDEERRMLASALRDFEDAEARA